MPLLNYIKYVAIMQQWIQVPVFTVLLYNSKLEHIFVSKFGQGYSAFILFFYLTNKDIGLEVEYALKVVKSEYWNMVTTVIKSNGTMIPNTILGPR